MACQNTPISRRVFLAGMVGTVAGAGVLSGASAHTQAASEAIGNEQWTHPKGNTAYNARFVNGIGPTEKITKAWEKGFGGWHERDSICVVDETVYAAGDVLYALDSADGTIHWEFRAEVPDRVSESMVSDVQSPTVMDGVVFAPVRFNIFDDDNPSHAAIVAVDADSGEKVWRIDAPVNAQFSDVTAVDETIYTTGPDLDGGWDRFVYALDPADGSVRWRRQSTVPHNGDGHPGHTPIVVDGVMFVSEQNGVNALDATSGDVVWEALPRVKEPVTAMVADGTLFVGENSEPGATIIALDTATGTEQWKQAYASEGYPGLNIGTVDSERLYIRLRAIDADVIALDRSDGSEAWRAAIPQPSDDTSRKIIPTTGMARVGELLYVGGAGLNPTDGSIVWKQGFESNPAGRIVLAAVTGGQMYLIDRAMGNRVIVLNDSETQTGTTPTAHPDDTDQQQDNTTEQAHTPTQSPPGSTDQPMTSPDKSTAIDTTDKVPISSSTTEDSPSTTESTTTTDGPGFGVLTTLAGVGVAGWRYLTTK